MEELTLVHPDDKDAKVVVSNPIQIAAYKGMGFVEADELEASTQAAAAEVAKEDEVADLKEQLAVAVTAKEDAEKAQVQAEADKKAAEDAVAVAQKAQKDAEKRATDAEKALKAAQQTAPANQTGDNQ